MKRSARSHVASLAFVASLVAACSSEDDTGDGGAGGAPNGGTAQGGSATGGSNSAGSAGASGSPGRGGTSSAGGGSGGTAGSGAAGSGAGGSGGSSVACGGNCRYVRSDATGANDGSSWDDAYTELPQTLERGGVYFVAAGDYPAYTFDDAEDGSSRIRVLRATVSDHGDGAGWRDAYAEGEATFGELAFETGAYDFDGRSALRAVGPFEGTVVSIDGNAVDFRGVDVDGAFAFNEDGNRHVAGACTGMTISGDDVVVAQNRVHHIADDGVVVGGSNNFTFEGNHVYALTGCGTDGGCGMCDNGHSDGLEIYAVTDSRFAGNFAHDIASTSAFFFGNWADELGDGPNDYCEDILLENNVFYNPETGFVVYLEDARGVTLFHNTFWGQHQGAYGGLAVGVNVSALTMVNNVILSVNFAHLASTFDPAEHRGDYNLFGKSVGQWEEAEHDIVLNDPGFSGAGDGDAPMVVPLDAVSFSPEATSPLRGAGTSDSSYALPSTDFFGNPRGSPPSIGAIE